MIFTLILKIKMLKISTFNIQNDFKKYNISKAKAIKDYVLDNEIDVLGLQELYSKCNVDLEREFKDSNYNLFGKYRFFLKRLLNRFNEKTAILTNSEVINSETYHLPSFPSLIKRIVTRTIILYKGKKISIYNTHLDYKNDKIKEKQLKVLSKLVGKDKNLIILMGDFNLKNNKKIFNDFVVEMKKNNIYRVEFGEKTFKNSKYNREIDHIFLSKEFKLREKSVIKNLTISDHYPVMVWVEL